METDRHSPDASPRLVRQLSCRLGAGLVAVAIMLTAGKTNARPFEVGAVPGISVRNGDWVAVDGLGVLLLGAPTAITMAAVVIRGEIGLGGSSAGIGLATNAFAANCTLPDTYDMSEFLGTGILSLEARVARMYGPTTWRSATYVGGQLSFAGILWKPAIAWMVATDDPRDRHTQITICGFGW